jgi:hypothetical protein
MHHGPDFQMVLDKFPLGHVVATPQAVEALEECGHHPCEFLGRHVTGDWGDLNPDEKRQNERSLRRRARAFAPPIHWRGLRRSGS